MRRRWMLGLVASSLVIVALVVAWMLRPVSQPASLARAMDESLLLDETRHQAQRGETAYCKPDAPTPAGADVVAASGREDAFSWAEGGGCVQRPARDVWATLHNQTLIVWDNIDETRARRLTPSLGLTHLYEVDYVAHEIITLEWVMQWSHALRQGTLAAPERVVVNYRRTSGTRHLPYWEGTILIEALGPELTAVTIRDQFKTRRWGDQDLKDAINSVQQLYAKMRDGEPEHTALQPLPDDAAP